MHVHCDSTRKDELDILAAACRKAETIAALSGGLRYGGHDYDYGDWQLVIRDQDNLRSVS